MEESTGDKGKREPLKARGPSLSKLYKLRSLQKMIANGYSVFDLEDYCVDKWNMSSKSARRYTADAYQGMAENYEGIDKRSLAFLLFARLEKCYAVARLEKNPAAMVAACKEMADRFYAVAPEATVGANMQSRENGTNGLDPEEDF